ncbi:hypothetical protein CWI38_1239p0010 [Hamiltosporidium tvaerminnensis]|uniref:Uncharacterized protein n=1 Tax=Hamiltosporidium tvaerminnensis TaxID=1176355 RepID=A0A4Q9LTA1_9MICR|nr:hypothetical protein CWI38_1239p0010 [Hamiltosporidium tvaerminnensis]
MATKINSEVGKFISFYREKKGVETKDLYEHQRNILLKRKLKNGEPGYGNLMILLFLAIAEGKLDYMEFISACGLKKLDIKIIGYLGANMVKDNFYNLMMVNTLRKDLASENYNDLSLTYICNLIEIGEQFKELKDLICLKSTKDITFCKKLIAISRLQDKPIVSKLIMGDSNILHVKLQILIDYIFCLKEKLDCEKSVVYPFSKNSYQNLKNSENSIFLDLCENDILYLISLYPRTTNINLKIKILQLFSSFIDKFNFNELYKLNENIEASIIVTGFLKKTNLEISLSIESAIFLFSIGYQSVVANSFVFRLIESRMSLCTYYGLYFARKFRIFKEVAIERCFSIGLHKYECLETVLDLITKANYLEIYKRKEEVFLIMESNLVKSDICHEKWSKILKKILKIADQEFVFKIFLENPYINNSSPVYEQLNEKSLPLLFEKIKEQESLEYFDLIYTLLPYQQNESHVLSQIFEKHLNILSDYQNKNFSKRIYKNITKNLINQMLKYGDLDYNRDIMLKHMNSYNNKTYNITTNILREYILIFNVLVDKKVFWFNIENIFEYEVLNTTNLTENKNNKFNTIKNELKKEFDSSNNDLKLIYLTGKEIDRLSFFCEDISVIMNLIKISEAEIIIQVEKNTKVLFAKQKNNDITTRKILLN